MVSATKGDTTTSFLLVSENRTNPQLSLPINPQPVSFEKHPASTFILMKT
jgi:hypothetical protein